MRPGIPSSRCRLRGMAGALSPCSSRLSISMTLSGYLPNGKNVVRNPSDEVGGFHSSLELHFTVRRCGAPTGSVSSKRYGPVAWPIPSTRSPSAATTTSPSCMRTTKSRISPALRPRFLGSPGYRSSKRCLTASFTWSPAAIEDKSPRSGQPIAAYPPSRIAGQMNSPSPPPRRVPTRQ